ncbi:helix-hairpin-helix domain-containing protein [archaeon]|nr:helix-hairpin-helix domain-containing protein [archaeon]
MPKETQKSKSLKSLQTLRNIGPVAARNLYSLGIKDPQQVKKADPEKLYEQLKRKNGGKLDRCVLYQFRGAIKDVPWPDCSD